MTSPTSFLRGAGRVETVRRNKPPADPESAAAAHERALRLLAVRPRGRVELLRALEDRGFAAAAVARALERLASQELLDDLSAARSAMRTRGSRYGRSRVERELKARGFDRETIAAADLAEGGAGREDAALRKAFERLWAARSDLAPPLKRRRVFDALTRRGFRPEKISEMIRGWYEVD